MDSMNTYKYDSNEYNEWNKGNLLSKEEFPLIVYPKPLPQQKKHQILFFLQPKESPPYLTNLRCSLQLTPLWFYLFSIS